MDTRIYLSGFTQRYHTNPRMASLGQTNGHHQWGVAVLMLGLFPDEMNLALVWEALHHDSGEMGTCDASYPNKQRYPDMARVIGEAEAAERADIGIPEAQLTDRETAILKLCDRLESYLFTTVHAPHVLPYDGWPEVRQSIETAARALGVWDVVGHLLTDVRRA